MVKTFREVLQNIKPGETWDCINDCNIKSISYIDKSSYYPTSANI